MKFFATFALSAFAVASAAECDSASLIAIATGADGAACTASTGFSAASLSIPVGDALTKVCSDANCQKLLKEITAAVPIECTLAGVSVKATLIDKFPAACAEALKSSGSTNSTSANSTATATTTAAPGTAMSASMDMDKEEVKASSGSSDAETPTAGKTTVSTPSPTTKSGTSAVAAATSAVVAVAVAAAML